MANTRISDLTASAANLAATDVTPVVQTTGVGPVKMTGLQFAGGLLGSTALTGSTVTTSRPVLNLSQTWNAVGVTFTGLKFNATDTASASGSLLLDLQVGGTTIFNVSKAFNAYTNTKNGGFAYLAGNSSGGLLGRSNNNGANGLFLGSGTQFGFTDGSGDTGNIDVILRRDNSNILALRNGTNAQTFNVYNTYTDASNYVRAEYISSTILQRSAGTGTGNESSFDIGNATGTTSFYINVANGTANRRTWQVQGNTGHFLAVTDSTFDIGASGASRPRNVYAAISLNCGSSVLNNTSLTFGGGGAGISCPASMAINTTGGSSYLTLNPGNSIVAFVGTTSSFPALKRSSASLICRLADDSANAAFEALSLKTGAPAGGTSGTWKVGVYNATAPAATGYVEVDIGGTLYKLLAAT